MEKKLIGVTDCSKYEAYAKWISQDEGVEAVKLSFKDKSFDDLKKCHGIVLTGGEDVHPRYYKKPEYLPYCIKDDISESRDEFEFKVLDFVKQNKLPLFGICRGLQVANVYFGGTLIPDIPSFGKFNHSKKAGADTYHSIQVDENSWMKKIVGVTEGEINSAHHQSAEIVAPDLVANAISKDGVIEGLEWKKQDDKPYMMLVQWHPERMIDQQNVFAQAIRKSFIEAVKS